MAVDKTAIFLRYGEVYERFSKIDYWYDIGNDFNYFIFSTLHNWSRTKNRKVWRNT